MGKIYVIGAGMAGLSCAVECTKAGQSVVMYEASQYAGGRCRSFKDEQLGCLIDNGNHLLIGANTATKNYLDDISSRDRISEITPAKFPFIQPATGERWAIKPGAPYFPMWLLAANRRIPRSTPFNYLTVFKLWRSKDKDTVEQVIGKNDPLYDKLWQPMSRAILNTDANEASAKLLWEVIKLSFLKGEAACRPIIFEKGLSAALVDPALNYLKTHDVVINYKSRLRKINYTNQYLANIEFSKRKLEIKKDDALVLAVPPDSCSELWPEANPPKQSLPIINIHFDVQKEIKLPGGLPFLGLIGTDAQWVFSRENIISVTISAAKQYIDKPNEEIARHSWAEIKSVIGSSLEPLPKWRVIKERRATIAQTPAIVSDRTSALTTINNFFIAGDWTDTGLPATIEGSIQSGKRAAALAVRQITKLLKLS